MSEQATKLVEQVLALPADDRLAVRRALRDRRRAELDDAEARIIQERSDSVHDGTAVLIDGEQFVADMLRRYPDSGAT